MILKCFYRKKTTKIYLIILIAILSLLGIIAYSREFNLKLGNTRFASSYIGVVAPKSELDKIKKIKNIKRVSLGLLASDNLTYSSSLNDGPSPSQNPHFFLNEELTGNNVYIGAYLNDNYAITNNAYHINDLKSKLNLNVIKEIDDFYKDQNYDIEVSKELYQKLEKNTNLYYYRLTLNNWLNHEKTEKELTNKINILTYKYENFEPNLCLESYEGGVFPMFYLYVLFYTIALIVLSIIFAIVLIATIHNILLDEQKSTYLYSCLGYNKKTVKTNNTLKIVSLISIAIIVSLCIVIIYGLLFKHA